MNDTSSPGGGGVVCNAHESFYLSYLSIYLISDIPYNKPSTLSLSLFPPPPPASDFVSFAVAGAAAAPVWE